VVDVAPEEIWGGLPHDEIDKAAIRKTEIDFAGPVAFS